MMFFLILIFVGLIDPVFAQSPDSSLKSTAVTIPGGEAGIGFDDMVFSSDLQKVLIPAGHTGKLYLIDPSTFAMTSVGGFSSSAVMEKGQEVGITSADEGEGYIFAADHGKNELVAIDLKTAMFGNYVEEAAANLAGDADYVRYVGVDHEIWVTEPHNKQIEVFKFSARMGPGPSSVGNQPVSPPALKVIAVIHFDFDEIPASVKGPESLVIDHLLGRAYTNFGHLAVAIDLTSHAIVTPRWDNECEKARGDALDEQKGFLFVSCAEGKAEVFDLNNGNKKISELATDPGPDVISYNVKLSHLYLTSSKNATLSVIGVSAQGKMSILGKAPADKRAHCVVSDDQNNIWVCDPPRGQLLRFKDTL